jgi:XTP/dITP diphosphohydrolase
MTTPNGPSPVSVGRVVLILTSPRVAPGMLSWPAWEALRGASAVFAVDCGPEWAEPLTEAGVTVTDLVTESVVTRAGTLVEHGARGEQVVWLGSADGDPGLTDALAEHLARHAVTGRPPEVEVLTGAYDVPGARLLDLVTVMDVLRSPGGCPWDAEQTHSSLLPHLLEETHEVIDAVEGQDRMHLREELGDLLLQVFFHARIAREHPQSPFDIDDVAAGIVEKLIRRHPHVFADVDADDPETAFTSWEEAKAAEKRRPGLFDGIPASMPSLARAQKMLDRLDRAGGDPSVATAAAAAGDEASADLLAAVQRCRRDGVDAEATLRGALSRLPTG